MSDGEVAPPNRQHQPGTKEQRSEGDAGSDPGIAPVELAVRRVLLVPGFMQSRDLCILPGAKRPSRCAP